MEHFYLRSDAHQSRIVGGHADVNHTQTIVGDTVKLLGGYVPPIPPGFRHPCIRDPYVMFEVKS